MLAFSNRFLLIVIIVIPSVVIYGEDYYAEYEFFLREQKRGIQEQRMELKQFMTMSEQEFTQWKSEEARRFEKHRADVKSRWGEYVESTRKCFVSYSEDFGVRNVVDFERGIVSVEVLCDSGEVFGEVKKRLTEAVNKVMNFKAKGDSLEEEPLLQGQVAIEELGKISEKARVDTTLAHRKKIGVTFPMIPDHIRRRAFKYYPLVKKYCDKFNLTVSHVMATIHTESLFNPLARSAANALGLMQIVPQSGGRDAFGFVYGHDGIPLPDMLYTPERNIELGCAYIHLLKTRHFGAVVNYSSNLYCSIAGYNTGPGNVAFAFVGKRELFWAIKAINDLKSPEEVYGRLINNLPFYETRVYLKNVIDVMQIYK